MIVDLDANVISNEGFNDAEVEYFREFTIRNKSCIEAESRGEFDA